MDESKSTKYYYKSKKEERREMSSQRSTFIGFLVAAHVISVRFYQAFSKKEENSILVPFRPPTEKFRREKAFTAKKAQYEKLRSEE